MFASLKNKIKEETGSDLVTTPGALSGPATGSGSGSGPQQLHRHMNHNNNNNNNNNNRLRSRFSSSMSINSNSDDTGVNGVPGGDQANTINTIEQVSTLRSQCSELMAKVADLTARLKTLQEEKARVEKTNEILLETVKVAQTQKDLYCEEQEKIQNLQQHEIDKLKNLLSFREQEAVDRLSALKQSEQQNENIAAEVERLKQFEHIVEDLRDELEQLRHSSQMGKNNLTTTLATVEEENRHLKKRLQVVEQTRLDAISTLGNDEKVQTLVQERKLLEQLLEEAHLQLSDIKGSWSGQNLALETQVSRLSKQVAEETTEKRKIQKARDDLMEKLKQQEFENIKISQEVKQREDKIRLLEEEIDELNSSLKECREENEHQVLYERNKAETLEKETKALNERLSVADARFSEYSANADHVAMSLRQQNASLTEKLAETQNQLESEKDEKLTALLRNAEISQSEEILKKELRLERSEANDLHERVEKLENDIKAKEQEIDDYKSAMDKLNNELRKNEEKLREIEDMRNEISEKNKTIKVLSQHVTDLKKTLRKEFNSSQAQADSAASSSALSAVTPADQRSSANGLVPSSSSVSVSLVKAKSPCSNCGVAITDGVVIMDDINFKYLKHVIVKFLTSREVEARQLVRAVATLLHLTKDEEKLLHDTLNWKTSWFASKPDPTSSQRIITTMPPSSS